MSNGGSDHRTARVLSIDSSLADRVRGLCVSCNARLSHALLGFILETPTRALADVRIDPFQMRSPIDLEVCPRLASSLEAVVDRLRPWVPLSFLVESALITVLATGGGGSLEHEPLASLACWQGATDEGGADPT